MTPWFCPYCGREIDEHGECCGEKGHATEAVPDEFQDS